MDFEEELYSAMFPNDEYLVGSSIKAVKFFKGHDGEELVQGDLYFRNKKIAFVSQDARGGMLNINIVNRDLWCDSGFCYSDEGCNVFLENLLDVLVISKEFV